MPSQEDPRLQLNDPAGSRDSLHEQSADGRIAVGWELWPANMVTDLATESHLGAPCAAYRDRPRSLTEMLRRAVVAHPDRDAVVEIRPEGARRLTYAAFERRVQRLAGALQDRLQVRHGDRVGLLMVNGIPFCLSVFALARLGAVAVPLNTKFKTGELEYNVRDAGAQVLIMNPNWWPFIRGIVQEGLIKQVIATEPAVLSRRSERSERAAAIPGALHFNALVAEGAPEDVPTTTSEEHDTVMLMYTSGTTGKPKGTMLSHWNVVHAAMTYERTLELGPDERTVVAVPLFHATGLVAQFVLMVHVGGTTAVLPTFHASQLLQTFQDESITFFHAAPTVYIMMLRDPLHRRVDLSHWRTAVAGGAAMPTETILSLSEWVPHLRYHTVFGMTEITSPGTIMPSMPWEEQLARPGSSGLPAPVNRCKVVDAEGRTLEPDEPGELLISGPTVAEGYWSKPGATERTFRGGWVRTGDVARIDRDGYVYILDRLKDMINRGAEKIYSVEVENVLHGHPKIAEAAVVGIPDPVYGEQVKAVIVTVPGERLSESDVRDWVQGRLAKFKMPTVVAFVDALPRNPGGKVIKSQLKDGVTFSDTGT